MSKEPNRNVYVGHRYVPKIMGEWDNQTDYEGLSIVTHQGASYTSKKRVPVGIDILNEEFWVVTGNYNAQIEYYRQDVVNVKNDLLNTNEELEKKADSEQLEKTINDIEKSFINAENFGIVGDGITDDSIALQQAIDFTAEKNSTLLFPDDFIMSVFDIKIICNIKGGSFISRDQPKDSERYNFMQVKAPVKIEDSVFDGNLTKDPDVWNDSNYNDFGGSIALYISSDDVRLINVTGQNSNWSNFRIENSKNVSLENCNSIRSRGHFGDGYYMANCNNVRYKDCTAYDFTRIGFVSERGSGVSYENIWDNCRAEYGHHNSVMFPSGGEFNGGFWSENSGENKFRDCIAVNVGSRGFTGASQPGSQLVPLVEVPRLIFSGCKAVNVDIGFSLSTQPDNPMIFKLDDCYAYTKEQPTGLNKGYQIILTSDKCQAVLNSCVSKYWSDTSNGSGFSLLSSNSATTAGTVVLKDCITSDIQTSTTQKFSMSTNSGDVTGGDSDALLNVVIDNLINLSGEYATIKFRHRGLNYNPNVKVNNSNISPMGNYESLDVKSSKIFIDDYLVNFIRTGKTVFDNCEIVTPISNISNDVVINNCKMGFTRITSSDGQGVSLVIDKTKFIHDMNEISNILRVQYEGDIKGKVMLSNSSFINSGVTNEDPAIHLVRTGTELFGSNVLYDDGITTLLRTSLVNANPEDLDYATATTLK